MKLTNDEFVSLMHYVMATDPKPDAHIVTDGTDAAVSALLDSEAMERGWSSWYAAYHEFPPLVREGQDVEVSVTNVYEQELTGQLTLPDPLVWVTRINPWLNGGHSRCLVNLQGVDAISPNDEGCALIWMAGQTKWDITETIEEVHALMTGSQP